MADLTPRNADYVTAVRSSFARQGLMKLFGARLARVDPGGVDVEVPFGPAVTQQQGWFHGAVSAAVADTACGYAALTLMPPGSEVVSVEFKVNLLAPAKGDLLVARGRVVRAGRTVTVCQGDVLAVTGDREVHCATLVGTMMRLEVA
ncbi:PaaI family thioesterase [Nocardioides pacificus]